ncbi:dipeptide/oligopeptide/nickel ABC transporter ATP-binding protein [Halarchaeum grantii]|uniref:Dipeptide/oligopeptide/nickel ABC transporter ATP-binding protein n=1 Tax=Halarchaeum grantii TaxID=1193105 RepID=A0A830FBN9_9EURY|nr:ABC transporter ATP-binding protein [Halarchaeum grantii]GGL38789.1 dipeptide/oligopeptide/nickel ABC transporter ATP-binding protein [Halarchaeum grantii]
MSHQTQHLPIYTDAESDTIIEAEDLSALFDLDRGESRVLNEVDMSIERGEILGVVGESGSGKSMFASALLDAVPEPGITTGDITFYPEDGEPVDVLDQSEEELRQMRWEDISMVFQGAMDSWNPTMSIGKHFEETLKAHDVPKGEGMERARELINNVYLDPERILNAYPHELSGGMKQRALIALSLVLEPEVLVMDEPTAALDLLMQRSIIALLSELRDEYNLTMVFITHDLELAAGLANRIAVLYAFEFVEVGTADDIINDGHHPYTRALINSTPNLETPVEHMEPIRGESPDPVNVPTGCSYHSRCPLADEFCETNDPDMMITNEDAESNEVVHASACHYWEQVPEEVPLHIEGVRVDE